MWNSERGSIGAGRKSGTGHDCGASPVLIQLDAYVAARAAVCTGFDRVRVCWVLRKQGNMVS